MRRFLPGILCAAAALPLSPALAVDAEMKGIALEDRVFFERRIRPILAEHCYSCHSEEAGKRKGGLWLDRKSGWELGGDSGAAIVPGHPEESLLIHSVHYEDADLEMPPEEKLPDAVVERLEEWIRRGAPDPRDGVARAPEKEIDIEASREFWSFQPVTNPKPPAVRDDSWPRGDIDRFILAKLEADDLSPSRDADRETLLRRVSLVLTGLPPSVAEQDAFLADESSEAFAAVVDRLLASKAFAERWGRHWLDITRYADTSGGGRAMALPDAWRFRDFVIDSFREDKPLDQLIREHIAGDLLSSASEDERMARVVATGFLVLGPHNYENQDKELLDLEIADEQIDTVGRAFLGMTIGCSRCHDHKFDPIPTQDYYALAGIFLSTKSVRHSNVSKWFTQPYRPTPEQSAAQMKFDKASKPLNERIEVVKKEITRLGQRPGKPEGVSSKNPVPLAQLRGLARDNTAAILEGDWQESVHTPAWVDAGYIHDQSESGVRKSVTWKVPVDKAGRYEVRVSYSAGPSRSTVTPVTIVHGEGETTVRINQKKPPAQDGLFHTVGTYGFAAGDAVVRITNDGVDGVVIADAVQLLPETDQNRRSLDRSAVDLSGEDAKLAEKYQKEYSKLQAELKALAKDKPKLPTVMAVAEGDKPADTPIRVRGMPRNFGDPAPRGFLRVAHRGAAPSFTDDRSGRLELAEWVASPDNPLTSRVLANRIWLHLMGEGIVASPDNFGTTGRSPTHPDLLDHLASRLIANGWSTKQLIREIILSRTWQMATTEGAGAIASRGPEVDPENTLLWKARRRRVDAETLRDSILQVSGNLDAARGGPSLPADFKSEFGYQYTSLKRSVYIPVFRNRMHEIFGAFDFANPNFVVGKRGSSTIPTQSLFLMNSPFMHKQAKAAARVLLAGETVATDRDRVVYAYRQTLCRAPRGEELRLTLDFIDAEVESGTPRVEAWAGLMRTLFSCVDFQFIP